MLQDVLLLQVAEAVQAAAAAEAVKVFIIVMYIQVLFGKIWMIIETHFMVMEGLELQEIAVVLMEMPEAYLGLIIQLALAEAVQEELEELQVTLDPHAQAQELVHILKDLQEQAVEPQEAMAHLEVTALE